jgi:hypothetical protein
MQFADVVTSAIYDCAVSVVVSAKRGLVENGSDDGK